jgi:hypothetical protein
MDLLLTFLLVFVFPWTLLLKPDRKTGIKNYWCAIYGIFYNQEVKIEKEAIRYNLL